MEIQLPDKIYFSIGEVAEAFRVNTSLIRYWEKGFDILRPKKNKKGDRLFTQEDIKNLKIIYHLVKEKGYTLDGAKTKIKEDGRGVKTRIEIIDRLSNIKSDLEKMRDKLL